MEEIHEKYSNLFKENENLKIRIKYLEMKLQKNEKENGCQQKLEDQSIDTEQKIKSLQNDILKYKTLAHETIKNQKTLQKAVSVISGYEFTFIENNTKLIVQSMYSLNEEDRFIFAVDDGRFNLVRNHMTEIYAKDIDTYLVKGRSISALLATVTLDLFSQNTLQ
ncbi:Mitotic checkpoint protein MAD1, partial [Pseudoloma neurophilia]